MRRNIAVIGRMHEGKTTFSQALSDLGYTRIAFADPVKDCAAAMLTAFRNTLDEGYTVSSYTRQDVNDMKGQPAIRKLLQLVGTELGREWMQDEDTWVRQFELHFWQAVDLGINVVNDDCRFPNEVSRLKELGFLIVRLKRDDDEREASILKSLYKENPTWSYAQIQKNYEETQSHASETQVNALPYDLMIHNVSVQQLGLVAKELATPTFDLEAYTRLNDARNRQLA
jgi:hypothetical protein